jgi:protein ImuB
MRALRLPEESVKLLKQFGMCTVSDVLSLPRESLAQRFGDVVPRRIRQLLGSEAEPIRAFELEERIFWSREFFSPLVSRERIRKALENGFERLFVKLRTRGFRSGYFSIGFEYHDAHFARKRLVRIVALNTATEELSLISSVLEPLLEKLSFPHGIISLHIEALSKEPLESRQGAIGTPTTRASDPEALDSLVNTLSLQLDRRRLRRLAFHESHLPERSFSYGELRARFGASLAPLREEAHPYTDFLDRPSCMLSPPEELTVIAMLPDSPPSWFQWRGDSCRVLEGHGPERIAPEWWRSDDDGDRDYFKIQDDTGRWLWIFRHNATHRWFVQGMWS